MSRKRPASLAEASSPCRSVKRVYPRMSAMRNVRTSAYSCSSKLPTSVRPSCSGPKRREPCDQWTVRSGAVFRALPARSCADDRGGISRLRRSPGETGPEKEPGGCPRRAPCPLPCAHSTTSPSRAAHAQLTRVGALARPGCGAHLDPQRGYPSDPGASIEPSTETTVTYRVSSLAAMIRPTLSACVLVQDAAKRLG